MAFGKGKGKGSSVEFQMREGKMAAAQKGALMNTEGRLWADEGQKRTKNNHGNVLLG